MCLAKAFVNVWTEEPVLQDITRLRIKSNLVELETLFGQRKVLPGRVIEVDFMASRILVGNPVEKTGVKEE